MPPSAARLESSVATSPTCSTIRGLFFLVRKNELPNEVKARLEELEVSNSQLSLDNMELDKSKEVLQERTETH